MSVFNQKRRFGQIDRDEPEMINFCQQCDLYGSGKRYPDIITECTTGDWPAHGKTYPEEPYQYYCPNRSLLRYSAEKVLERMGGKQPYGN